MLEKILPERLNKIINEKINYSFLNEIRLRTDKPIVVFISGQAFFLSDNGTTSDKNLAICCSKQMVEDIVFRASECSLYSVNEQIKQGFLMAEGGIRIGIAGTLVQENENIKTIKNFSSLCIRIPHEIRGSCLGAFSHIVDAAGVKNTLIISPPGCGKTTFLRDFLLQLSNRNICLNTLVVDERGEIAGGMDGCGAKIAIGNFCDIMSFSNKTLAIETGIRSLNPNLIVTDELGGVMDVNAIKHALNCGVNVVASVHGDNFEDLKRKKDFEEIIKNKYFDRYVILSSKDGPGTYEGVYDNHFERISAFY